MKQIVVNNNVQLTKTDHTARLREADHLVGTFNKRMTDSNYKLTMKDETVEAFKRISDAFSKEFLSNKDGASTKRAVDRIYDNLRKDKSLNASSTSGKNNSLFLKLAKFTIFVRKTDQEINKFFVDLYNRGTENTQVAQEMRQQLMKFIEDFVEQYIEESYPNLVVNCADEKAQKSKLVTDSDELMCKMLIASFYGVKDPNALVSKKLTVNSSHDKSKKHSTSFEVMMGCTECFEDILESIANSKIFERLEKLDENVALKIVNKMLEERNKLLRVKAMMKSK